MLEEQNNERRYWNVRDVRRIEDERRLVDQ